MASPKGKKPRLTSPKTSPREKKPRDIGIFTPADVLELTTFADRTLTTVRSPTFGGFIKLPSGRSINPVRFATVIANSGFRTVPDKFANMTLLYDALDFNDPTWLNAQRRVLTRDRSVVSSILAYADADGIDEVLSEYVKTGRINFEKLHWNLTIPIDNRFTINGPLIKRLELLKLENPEENLFKQEYLNRALDEDIDDWVKKHRILFEKVMTKLVISMRQDLEKVNQSVPPLPHDIFVYKGIKENKNLGKKNDTYIENKFLSTSRDLKVALGFALKALLIIRIPETLKGIAVDQLDNANSNEKEILFQPGSVFLINSVIDKYQFYDEDFEGNIIETDKIKKVYHLTYIGQTPRVRSKKIRRVKKKKSH